MGTNSILVETNSNPVHWTRFLCKKVSLRGFRKWEQVHYWKNRRFTVQFRIIFWAEWIHLNIMTAMSWELLNENYCYRSNQCATMTTTQGAASALETATGGIGIPPGPLTAVSHLPILCLPRRHFWDSCRSAYWSQDFLLRIPMESPDSRVRTHQPLKNASWVCIM